MYIPENDDRYNKLTATVWCLFIYILSYNTVRVTHSLINFFFFKIKCPIYKILYII